MRIIWSNENLNLEDWRDDLIQDHPEASDEELTEIMERANTEYFDDEKANLQSAELPNAGVVFQYLGLWNGLQVGVGSMKEKTVGEILRWFPDCDYMTWFVNGEGDLCCDATHHDGTNHYVYRCLKDGEDESDVYAAMVGIRDQAAQVQVLIDHTQPIGYLVKDVYGWEDYGPEPETEAPDEEYDGEEDWEETDEEDPEFDDDGDFNTCEGCAHYHPDFKDAAGNAFCNYWLDSTSGDGCKAKVS